MNHAITPEENIKLFLFCKKNNLLYHERSYSIYLKIPKNILTNNSPNLLCNITKQNATNIQIQSTKNYQLNTFK